jgi:hypothetical protein
MPISHQNIITALSLMTALAQRHDAIHQLANQLSMPHIWRSPDGSLSVPIPPDELAQLEAFISTYLDECTVLHATLRAMLTKP